LSDVTGVISFLRNGLRIVDDVRMRLSLCLNLILIADI